jgi:signal transduction protein with GAF and PtsI domain
MVRSGEHPVLNTIYLDLLVRIGHLYSCRSEPQRAIEQIVDELISELSIQACWIQIFDTERQELRLLISRGLTEEITKKMDFMELGNDPISEVILKKEPWVCSDITTTLHQGFIISGMPGIRSLAAIPLQWNGFTLGVMGLCSNTPNRFGEYEFKLFSIVAVFVASLIEEIFNIRRRNQVSTAQVVE